MAAKALIVIDMLEDFLSPHGNLYVGPDASRVVREVAAEIARARAAAWPIIYLCDVHAPGDREFAMFPPHCLGGSPGARVVPELTPQPGDIVISKRRFSGFFATDLDLALRERGIEELVLVGVCTNICILYTAADARMLGYEVTVLTPGVCSFDRGAHDFALGQLESVLGCRVK